MQHSSFDGKCEIAGIAPDGDEPFDVRYLKYVAISEGCGCAERVIANRRGPSKGDGIAEIYSAVIGRIRKLLQAR